MTRSERKVKPELKRLLITKAGGKCANPGCSNWRVHIHHIKHWAVYKSHNADDMIAICPSCHDAVHHGQLKITDDTLYQWKGLVRPPLPDMVHIDVEPANELKLLTGSVCITTASDQVAIFELSNANHLKLRVLDKDLLLVSARLQDQKGLEIFRVVENHVRVVRNGSIVFDYRPGRARITLPATDDFAPVWLINQMRTHEPQFAKDGRVVALDIEVMKPGLVRIQGCWPDNNIGVVITDKALVLCGRGPLQPISIIGEGEDSVIRYNGPVTRAMLDFLAPEIQLNFQKRGGLR